MDLKIDMSVPGGIVALPAGSNFQILEAAGKVPEWKSIAELTQPVKHPCEYCHGITPDDSRGGCCACGAPRKQEKKLDHPYYALMNWRFGGGTEEDQIQETKRQIERKLNGKSDRN